MSGHNRGELSKQCTVIQSGALSGRSLAYKKGPGAPGKKKKRAVWYEGPPLKPGNKENETVSRVYGAFFRKGAT